MTLDTIYKKITYSQSQSRFKLPFSDKIKGNWGARLKNLFSKTREGYQGDED